MHDECCQFLSWWAVSHKNARPNKITDYSSISQPRKLHVTHWDKAGILHVANMRIQMQKTEARSKYKLWPQKGWRRVSGRDWQNGPTASAIQRPLSLHNDENITNASWILLLICHNNDVSWWRFLVKVVFSYGGVNKFVMMLSWLRINYLHYHGKYSVVLTHINIQMHDCNKLTPFTSASRSNIVIWHSLCYSHAAITSRANPNNLPIKLAVSQSQSACCLLQACCVLASNDEFSLVDLGCSWYKIDITIDYDFETSKFE